MVCPRKIMSDSETQEFEWLNFLKRIIEKVDRRICQMVLLERDRDSVKFVRIERYIPSI